MTIGIVTGFSGKNAAGLEEFLLGLLGGLAAERPAGVEYVIYTSTQGDLAGALRERGITDFQIISVGFGKWWKQFGLIFAPRADTYLWNGPVISPLFFPRRSFVLVYDFAYRHYGARGLQTRAMDALSALAFRRAQKVIAISQATADDVVKLFGTPRARVMVMHPGVKDLSDTKEVAVETPRDGYFLFVGTAKERKNLLNLIRGYIESTTQGLREHLLIAGRNDPSSAYGKQIIEAIASSGVSERIRFLGHVSDGELVYLYRHAIAFTFPSAFEGFGMPVVEAQRLGVPVLTSSTSSLPEAAGEGALLIAPDDIRGMASLLKRLSREPELRAELIEKGKENTKRFSWEKSAQELLSYLQSV